MGRRRNVIGNRFEDGSRSTIGDSYVEKACADLNAACVTEAAMFTQAFTAAEVTPMIFKDEAIARVKAVHGLLAYEGRDGQYDLQPFCNGTLTLMTTDRPAASTSAFHWHPDRAAPLKAAVDTLNDLHVKWGAVKYLLRWFNRHATPGAVRANWPSVLSLCPDAPSLKELQHAPVRYTNPQELSALLPLIRATATTVAAMKMLPSDAHPRVRGSAIINLQPRKVTYEGVEIALEQQIFYL
jgi:hypothetical protein